MRWKSHVQCESGEKLEITSNSYLSISIRIVMMKLQKADLNTIYNEIEKVAASLIANNPNYKAKIRQTLQKHYNNVERGVWSL